MSKPTLSHDENWPRASSLLQPSLSESDLAIIGVPASQTSLSQTSAHLTPGAIREALARYSTYAASRNADLTKLAITDLGDIDSPDFDEGETRVAQKLSGALDRHKFLVALGGDNSITYSVAKSVWDDLENVGVITLDAHHDVRDGKSNGSPIWRLIQAGLPGTNVVQIGISDFANSEFYSRRAADAGITVFDRESMRRTSIASVIANALAIAGANNREIYVDIDVDVCDRSVAPACPASVPGGLTADELREAVYLLANDQRVRAMDITEIDAALDTPDRRTIRLAALLVLEAGAGLVTR